MILLPLYAIAIWVALYLFRRRWQGYVILGLCILPVGTLTHFCIEYLPLPSHEPRPVWLYGISAAYAMLILIVGLVIVVQRGTPRHNDCHTCGYDLTGNAAGLCPECGTPVRCRGCHAELSSIDFKACHQCGEPFPLFPPKAVPVAAPVVRSFSPRDRARRFAVAREGWSGGGLPPRAKAIHGDGQAKADDDQSE
ncbi:MAG: zinc ribbon domain-containing protein [Planctomycetota bacterium]